MSEHPASGSEPTTDGSRSAADAVDQKQDADIQQLDSRVERRERVTLVVAIVGVLIAGASVYVSHRQREVMSEQLKDARESAHEGRANTNRALKVAEDQASALKVLAESTRQATVASNRAWLSIGIRADPIVSMTSNPPIIGRTWAISAPLENGGRSSAQNLTVRMSAVSVPRGAAPKFGSEPVILRDATIAAYGNTRTPGVPFLLFETGRPVGPISAEAIADISAGRRRLFVHGRATYKDSFGCHWSTFCYSYRLPEEEWTSCERNNDTGDERCGE